MSVATHEAAHADHAVLVARTLGIEHGLAAAVVNGTTGAAYFEGNFVSQLRRLADRRAGDDEYRRALVTMVSLTAGPVSDIAHGSDPRPGGDDDFVAALALALCVARIDAVQAVALTLGAVAIASQIVWACADVVDGVAAELEQRGVMRGDQVIAAIERAKVASIGTRLHPAKSATKNPSYK